MLRSTRTVCVRGSRAMSGASTLAKLPDLSYDYGELEPYISAEIMQLHHSKHHQTYVTNYNVAAEQMDSAIAKNDFAKQIALQGAIRFNGGGHVNHTMFWQNLAPNGKGGGGEPVGSLRTAIDSQFQTFDAFKKTFSASTAAVQGSGWGWLVYDANVGGIRVMTTPNQDPVSMHGVVPLLGIDVWEHAYYLQYKNVRPDYLGAIWNVVNWTDVQKRYEAATSK